MPSLNDQVEKARKKMKKKIKERIKENRKRKKAEKKKKKTHRLILKTRTTDTRGKFIWSLDWDGRAGDKHLTQKKWNMGRGALPIRYLRIKKGAFAFYSKKNFKGKKYVLKKGDTQGYISWNMRRGEMSWKAI